MHVCRQVLTFAQAPARKAWICYTHGHLTYAKFTGVQRVAVVAEDMIPRMLAATSYKGPSELQQSTENTSMSVKQATLSAPQQRLQRLKTMLMGHKPDTQGTNGLSPFPGEQHIQQQQQQQPKSSVSESHAAEAQQKPLRSLSSSLQNLQARLKSKTLQQPNTSEQLVSADQAGAHLQSSSNVEADADQRAEAHNEQQDSQPAGVGRSTEPEPGNAAAAETRLQKLARLTWRRRTPLDAAVVQQQDSKSRTHFGSDNGRGKSTDVECSMDGASEHDSKAEKGIALDAAVQQPTSLLCSFSQKLPMFRKQAPNLIYPDAASSRSELTATMTAPQPDNLHTTAQPEDTSNTPPAAASAESASQAMQQPVSLWQRLSSQVGLHVNSAVRNTSSGLGALTAMFPSYVHIGSHQILLPASPALTQAVQSAQQQDPVEQQRQALLMHSMAAYRGRALAICR